MGYNGETCQSCIKLATCVHGTCNTAFQCNCDPGWQGRDCNIASCSDGCHPDFGFCDRPDSCLCKHGSGMQGPNCTECIAKEGKLSLLKEWHALSTMVPFKTLFDQG